MPTTEAKKKSALLFWICVGSLMFTILLAIFDALFRRQSWQFLFLGNPERKFWIVWEVAAIVGALAGTMVYWLVQYLVEPKIYKLMNRGGIIGLSPIVIAATLVLFIFAAFEAWNHGDLHTQLLYLSGGVLGFVVVQGMFLWDTGNPTKKQKNVTALKQAREDLRGAMVYSDVPALIAFMTLFAFVGILLDNPSNDTLLRPFVGGVVAFELVTTNVVFVFEFWHTPPYLSSKFPSVFGWWKRLLE